MRAILYGLLFLLAAGIGYVAFDWYAKMNSGDAYGAPFQLVDQTGAVITEKEFRAQPSAVFFGFTHCPEICPTTLFELDSYLKQLGPDGEKLRVFFVSVDPERDTPEIMNQYVSNVSNRITGVTGDAEKIAAMAKAFNIYSRRVDTGGGDYTMDHTASVILLDKGGAFTTLDLYNPCPATTLTQFHPPPSGA